MIDSENYNFMETKFQSKNLSCFLEDYHSKYLYLVFSRSAAISKKRLKAFQRK